jgi:hypothetical protein
MPINRDWNTFEGKPADTDNISLGAGEIRYLKTDIRERMVVDHVWNVSTTADGAHLKATLKDLAGDPVMAAGFGFVYAKTASGIVELFYKDSLGNITQITSVGAIDVPAPLTLSQVYPVGCIYTTISATSPATTFGMGTWALHGAGRVLVGYSSGDPLFGTVGNTGGATTVTLDITQIPSHNHPSAAGSGGATSAVNDGGGLFGGTVNDAVSGSRGGGLAHTNLQPYIVVYFWLRTA